MNAVTNGATAPSVSADLAQLGLQVNPGNIVQVSNVLRAEAEFLSQRLDRARLDSQVGEPGKDPVSLRAAAGFNRKINAMYDQVQAYCDALAAASNQLVATAKSYGHTDDDIARSLASIQPDYGRATPLMTPAPPTSTASLAARYLPPPPASSGPPGDRSPILPEPDDGWVPLIPPSGSTR